MVLTEHEMKLYLERTPMVKGVYKPFGIRGTYAIERAVELEYFDGRDKNKLKPLVEELDRPLEKIVEYIEKGALKLLARSGLVDLNQDGKIVFNFEEIQ